MNSLQKRKYRQGVAVFGAAVALAGLTAFHLLRPSPEERAAADLRDVLIAGGERRMDPAERERMRAQWERLSPETRKGIVAEVSRARIDDMRRENAHLTAAERRDRIDREILDMRRRRRALSETERAEFRERMSSEEARDMVRHILELYQTELTGRERAELDPLVHEWIRLVEWELHDYGR